MTVTPEELADGSEWTDHRDLTSGATEEEAEAHDAWFREVADPAEIAERDARVAEAEQNAGDAYDQDNTVEMNHWIHLRERHFWAMPLDERDRPDADEAVRHDAAADDDADGW